MRAAVPAETISAQLPWETGEKICCSEKTPLRETIIRRGEIQRRGNNRFGKIPIAERPTAEINSAETDKIRRFLTLITIKLPYLCSGHEKLFMSR
jgi:hypothetical protein